MFCEHLNCCTDKQMGAGITFQLVALLAAVASAWLWLRHAVAATFFAAFGAATTAKCYPQWLEVPAETREGEPVTLAFAALDAATLRDHFYGLRSSAPSVRQFAYVYTPPTPAPDADDELARFMRPPVQRELLVAHRLEVAGDGYRVARGDTVVTSGSSSRVYV